MAYRSVVVGTDGSETAEVAVRNAAQLAATDSARLVIVTAFAGGATNKHLPDEAPADLRWQINDATEAEAKARKGREIAEEVGAHNVVVQAVEGEPAQVVLDTATDFDADVIVVGSKGLTAPTRYVLGSVAGTVAHHAPCDVLIVHTT